MNNFTVIVLDGVGVGELDDADKYKDVGSDTLGNISRKLNGLTLPNLQAFGLGNLHEIVGVPPHNNPKASYGKLAEISIGKDSTTGHWELGGLKIDYEFPLYPNGFPQRILNLFMEKTGVKGILGNKAASGTEIIKELGDEHVKTGFPIVYTSADPVFQIAAHEEIIPLEKLLEMCRIARHEVMIGDDQVGRIIARPFVGDSGCYTRTTNRKDFSVNPPSKTILNVLQDAGIDTIAVGKINDLFNYNGIKISEITKSNMKGVDKILESQAKASNSFIFANLVDFDVYFGHRNDPEGFYNALVEFDNRLPEIIASMDETDALVLTADHGNDPTTSSTDHSREYVPLLFYRKGVKGKNLGVRKTFADVAQTVAHFFKVNNNLQGTSFLNG
ncbi:MAG: phosphopentomutase [Bacteroidetes bacterium]|nr:phosphopentomutase [Bacteroidota bacterium]